MSHRQDKLAELLSQLFNAEQADAYSKTQQALDTLSKDFNRQRFFYLFAICQRWFDKAQPPNSVFKNPAWKDIDPFNLLESWHYTQLARLFILLETSRTVAKDIYIDSINQLYKSADVNEMILLGQSLSFIPYEEEFIDRARESARSNIASVFSSIAHDSNYAKRHFDFMGWNQLILKAAFLAVPIWNIAGLKERNNPELVKMLRNYVTERQAAGRSVPWDLWCCIAWHATGEDELEYLRNQWRTADNKTRAAIALALSENDATSAQTLANKLFTQIETHEPNWPAIAGWPN